MLIDKAEIERVKRAHELVAFIRRRGVTLTQRGKQLVGLCPFHDDHEPSLVVDARKQLWNCLGACREGGDVYRFVMKADGVDFREAHRRLGGNEPEPKSVGVEDQGWLERVVDHYHARGDRGQQMFESVLTSMVGSGEVVELTALDAAEVARISDAVADVDGGVFPGEIATNLCH